MKKNKIALLLITLLAPFAAMALTPGEVLTKASQQINNAKSITAKFSGSTSGTLVSSGSKFSIVAGGFGIWYNGKDMWSYSSKAGETTLSTPTPSELLETNPMEIIKSYSTQFTPTKISADNGKYTIKLTPKSKSNNVKTATLVIDTSTWFPVSIDMVFSNNQRMTINIQSISAGNTVPSSSFVYPRDKYPGVDVVDLR